MSKTVTQEYLDGIAEGREEFKKTGLQFAFDHLDVLDRCCKEFAASSPVGQMMRGERDFWRNQIKKARTNA